MSVAQLKEQIKAKRHEQAKAIEDARAYQKKAEAEKRSLTVDESVSLSKALDLADSVRSEIEKINTELRQLERIQNHVNELEASRGRPVDPVDPNPGNPAKPNEFRWKLHGGRGERVIRSGGRRVNETAEYRDVFGKYLAGQLSGDAFRAEAGRLSETRDMQMDLGVEGGFLVAPLQMVAGILKGVDDIVFIRQAATVFQLRGAESLGRPTLDADISDSDWTSEIGTGTNDTALKIGRRELKPAPLAKRIRISQNLLLHSAENIEAMVQERMAYKFGITQERAFLVGNGVNQPLGVFVASANGINTDRDVVTGSSTGVTSDGLKNAFYGLKQQYMQSTSIAWVGSRDFARRVALLKDAENRYYLQPNLRDAEGELLMGKRLVISEYAPNTFTTGQYVAVLADFSFYYIAESLSLTIQRLNELYAESNQIGYIGRAQVDGMPALSEAFVRLRCD
jgi:HK97 family phage major capsid protein